MATFANPTQPGVAGERKLSISTPPGYGNMVPLDRLRHAGLGLRADYSYRWCAGLNSSFLNAVEIARAALDYPIAFIREASTGDYLPIAVLGLRSGENLFIDSNGRWRPQRYVPAFVRRHPFCLVEIPAATPEAAAQKLICVVSDQLGPSLNPLFDTKGEPTPAWAPRMQLIEAVDNSQQQTRNFCRKLDELGLLTAFDALALPQGGGVQMRLAGLFRIDVEKLNALEDEKLRPLMPTGELQAIYAHLLSLDNFARLLELTTEADGRRTQAN